MLAICSILIWTYLLITPVYTAWIREWGGGGGGDYLHLCFLEKQISTIGCFFGFIGRLLDWGKIKMSIGEMGKNLRSHTKILGWHTFYTWVLLISKFKFDVIIYYHVWFWGNVYLAWLWFEYLSCLVCDFVIVLPCCDVTINMFIIQFYFLYTSLSWLVSINCLFYRAAKLNISFYTWMEYWVGWAWPTLGVTSHLSKVEIRPLTSVCGISCHL